ncbi:MAG: hypothetical protein JKY60_06110 [Kordiimonadaceae bacterium]|nr:hypothetical protein [Kordiimonadaceae bacterium]
MTVLNTQTQTDFNYTIVPITEDVAHLVTSEGQTEGSGTYDEMINFAFELSNGIDLPF